MSIWKCRQVGYGQRMHYFVVKYMPDYEIIEWNESYTDFSRNLFAHEAYESKKWAFVSDYVRLLAFVETGGIYFDTDVEILKPFDDLMENKAVEGFEEDKFVMTEVLVSEEEHPIIFIQSTIFEDHGMKQSQH